MFDWGLGVRGWGLGINSLILVLQSLIYKILFEKYCQ